MTDVIMRLPTKATPYAVCLDAMHPEVDMRALLLRGRLKSVVQIACM